MKFIWFKVKHSKLVGIPSKYTSTSSSPPVIKKNPCDQGVKYWCFSKSTAKHCNYVGFFYLRKELLTSC